MRLTGLYTGPRYEVTYPNGDLVQQVTACFECRIAGGSPTADGDEIRSLAFFAPERMPHTPLWYADMIRHALNPGAPTFFEPPLYPPIPNPQSPISPSPISPTGDYLAWLRRAVGHAPLVAPGCAALVRDEAGRVLLQLRADFGRWGLPAGAMDLGETAADTVIRETRKETGLHVEPLRLLDLQSGDEVTFPNGDRLFVFGMLFACRAVGGRLRPDGRESLDVRFFPLGDLPPLASPRLARAIANHGVQATFD
ncbi:MAG: NUDIX domain-containing protein [Chloroflexi bacterium]|nr:NUDIX domain-containing protein [Chloroflexota bacterium]